MKKQLTPQEWGMLIGQEAITTRRTHSEKGKSMITIDNDQPIHFSALECKPIRRRMESMTEEQVHEVGIISAEWLYNHPLGAGTPSPAEVIRIISCGFDVFGWIDQELAVDRDTLGKDSHIAKLTCDGETESMYMDGELVSQRPVKRTIPEYVTEEMVKAAKEDYLKHFSILNLHSSPDLYVIVLEKHKHYLDLLRRYQEQCQKGVV